MTVGTLWRYVAREDGGASEKVNWNNSDGKRESKWNKDHPMECNYRIILSTVPFHPASNISIIFRAPKCEFCVPSH